MRIVSQNRLHSLDFNNAHVFVEYNNICANDAWEKNILLGSYSSDVRAAEVFDDIHSAYNPVGVVTVNMNEDMAKVFIGSVNTPMNIVNISDDQAVDVYDNMVYYMPLE